MKTHHPKEQRLIHDNGVKLNPSSRKNLDVRPYDRATFNMRVQLYRGHRVVQWSVHWALSRTARVLILAGVTRCALETCGKKNASSAFRLG